MEGFCEVERGIESLTDVANAGVNGVLASYTGVSTTPATVVLLRLIASLGGINGLCGLLGQRQTTGTVDRPPWPMQELLDACNQPFAKAGKTGLTVGAKALSKHAPRCASKWWGDCTGNDKKKNEEAAGKVEWLLREATWMNTHHLPNGDHIYEARCAEGYGARWVLPPPEEPKQQPPFFRGFLEPQSDAGHARRWRH